MKNERTALIVGIIFLIIVNLFVGIWLFTDESDKPDTQASTVAADESTEKESGGAVFTTEEPMSEEPQQRNLQQRNPLPRPRNP